MREAPALAGVTGPRSRPAAPRRPKPPANAGWRSSLVGRAFARPGVTVAGAVFAALMTGIVVNAVFFQNGHRPTPLFGSARHVETKPPVAPTPPAVAKLTADTAAPPVAPAVSAVPAPASAPIAVSLPAPATAAARPQSGPKPPTHAKTSPPHAHSDSIARLLGTLGGASNRDIKGVETGAAKPKPKSASQKPKPVATARVAPQN